MGGITGALLAPLLAGPARPRLIVYGGGGSRVELSTATLANWSAKVAGLLTDELGAAPGDAVLVRSWPAWQTGPILLGAWWAGLAVTLGGGDRGRTDNPGTDSPVAAFVRQGDDADADEVFAVSADPLGAPCRDLPAHQRDFSTAVLGQSDRFAAPAVDPGCAALLAAESLSTVADMLRSAREYAATLGPGARLLSTTEWADPTSVTATLLAALAADGTLVQVPPGLSPERLAEISAAERITESVPD